jgi:TPR repeat protein/uncharacterized caspase-like protein
MLAALAAGCLLLCLPGAVQAQSEPPRFALIFGNSHYEGGTWGPLANPSRDAQAIAKALRSVGFQVVGCGDAGVCLDGDRARMESAMREFGRKLQANPGAVAFIYYSGHGVQARRAPDAPEENFLVPLRADLEEEFEVAYKAVPVQEMLDALAAVGAQAGIVVLDACRNNGLKRPTKSSSTKGLALNGAGGILIGYAAEPGQVALDTAPGSSEPMSPYARRLAEQLVMPGKSITDVFLDVRAQVIADTGGQQKPDAVMRLTRNLYLAGIARPPSSLSQPAADSLHRPDSTAAGSTSGPAREPATSEEMNARGDDYYYGRNGFQQNETEAVRWYTRAAQQRGARAAANLGYMYEHGRGGLRQSDAEAVRWYTQAAQQGDSWGQAYLGIMHQYGRGGLTKSDTEAVRLYTQAAEQDNARGQSYLGVMYRNGEGVTKQNDAEAVRWFIKSAGQGDSWGEVNLGFMYERGRGGLPQDDTQAVGWYTKAAEHGQGWAQANLGLMYEEGRGGLVKSASEAVRWYTKAAVQGDAHGQAYLGVMYRNGRGVTEDDAEAVRWLRKAADQGDAWGQANLGLMYEEGRGGLAKSDADAVSWYTKSAEQGNARGQAYLGVMYRSGQGVTKNDTEAVRWFKKAADQKDGWAQFNLGLMYEQGRGGLPKSDADAVGWYTKAADQGERRGEYYLGNMYLAGRGVAQNDAEAVRWYTKAAAQGDPDAQAYLKARGLRW